MSKACSAGPCRSPLSLSHPIIPIRPFPIPIPSLVHAHCPMPTPSLVHAHCPSLLIPHPTTRSQFCSHSISVPLPSHPIRNPPSTHIPALPHSQVSSQAHLHPIPSPPHPYPHLHGNTESEPLPRLQADSAKPGQLKS